MTPHAMPSVLAGGNGLHVDAVRPAPDHGGLDDTVLAMASTLRGAEVLDTLATRALALTGAHRAYAYELDPRDERLHLRAAAGQSDQPAAGAIALGQGVAGRAALRGALVICSGDETAVGAPLELGENALGTVALYWDAPVGAHEVKRCGRLLVKLARHAAAALGNARRFEACERRLNETAALLQIAEVVNSQLELKPVLKEVARRTAQLLGFDRCSVFLWKDGRAKPVMSQYADGRSDPALWAAFAKVGQYRVEEIPALAEAVRRAAPLVIEDAQQSSLVSRWWSETFNLRSVVVVPLIRQDQVIGVLHLDKTDSALVGESQLALAMTIAGQVAMAVDTARHFAEEHARAAQLAAQLEITQVTTGTIEFKPLLKAIAQHSARAMDLARCSITLWRDGQLLPVMSQFADGRHDPALWEKFKRLSRRSPHQVSLAHMQAIEQKRPVLIEDAQASPLLAPDSVEVFGIRAALIVPLIAKGEAIGTLTFDEVRAPRHWSATQVDLAMTIAGQVALSVENARLFDESQRARADLQEKNAELDTFVYSVSHDLKAPLVTIQGMAGLLLEEYQRELPPDAARYLGRIQANTQQMERLIVDLLALSRIGREARSPAAVKLADVLDDVAAELAAPIRERGISLVLGDLPTIWGIRTQVEQVLRNLVGNAVKYLGDGGSGRIEVGAADQGAFVECYVRDNGIGIDPAYHERIFEVFQRLKEIEVEGTGVGLAIVKKIVHSAGGRIWVESAKGQGATFRFTWPKKAGG
jgi:signal transduction histidine kinase